MFSFRSAASAPALILVGVLASCRGRKEPERGPPGASSEPHRLEPDAALQAEGWPLPRDLPPSPIGEAPAPTRFPVVIEGKAGYIDARGKLVIPPEWDRGDDFSEGMAGVVVDGKLGYIDEAGKMVISPRFDDGGSFSQGLAPVRVGARYGYADRTGRLVIPAVLDSAGYFEEGLADVKLSERWNLLSRVDGRPLTPDGFVAINGTSEGLAPVRVGDVWGYVDATGSFVIAPRFEDAFPFFEGLAAVKVDGKWGYIDRKGSLVIEPRYDFVHGFGSGLAAVCTGPVTRDQCGVIDRSGKLVIELRLPEPLSFEGDRATISLGEGKGTGLVDRTGRIVLRTEWEWISLQSGAPIAAVGKDDDRVGYIDLEGNVIWAPSQ